MLGELVLAGSIHKGLRRHPQLSFAIYLSYVSSGSQGQVILHHSFSSLHMGCLGILAVEIRLETFSQGLSGLQHTN